MAIRRDYLVLCRRDSSRNLCVGSVGAAQQVNLILDFSELIIDLINGAVGFNELVQLCYIFFQRTNCFLQCLFIALVVDKLCIDGNIFSNRSRGIKRCLIRIIREPAHKDVAGVRHCRQSRDGTVFISTCTGNRASCRDDGSNGKAFFLKCYGYGDRIVRHGEGAIAVHIHSDVACPDNGDAIHFMAFRGGGRNGNGRTRNGSIHLIFAHLDVEASVIGFLFGDGTSNNGVSRKAGIVLCVGFVASIGKCGYLIVLMRCIAVSDDGIKRSARLSLACETAVVGNQQALGTDKRCPISEKTTFQHFIDNFLRHAEEGASADLDLVGGINHEAAVGTALHDQIVIDLCAFFFNSTGLVAVSAVHIHQRMNDTVTFAACIGQRQVVTCDQQHSDIRKVPCRLRKMDILAVQIKNNVGG